MTWFEPVLAGAVLPLCVVAYVVFSLTQHRRKAQGYEPISLRLPWSKASSKPPIDHSIEVGAVVVPAEKAPVVTSSKTASPFPDIWNPSMTSDEREQMVSNKRLYHKLQNVEDHPGETIVISLLPTLDICTEKSAIPSFRRHRRIPRTSSTVV
jgi:hypothetical protein